MKRVPDSDACLAAAPAWTYDSTVSLRVVLFSLLVSVALWHGIQQWRSRPLHPPEGMIAPDDPVQGDPGAVTIGPEGRWRLTARASYDVTARVLGREDYRFDALAALIPEDLALGWGRMSDGRILRWFRITQGGRFYFWSVSGQLPIPREEVIGHSANTHLIPANEYVRRQLTRVRVGQLVHLVGLLVDATRDDGTRIRTSLTRTDSGPGSCEVMYVEEVE